MRFSRAVLKSSEAKSHCTALLPGPSKIQRGQEITLQVFQPKLGNSEGKGRNFWKILEA